MNGVMEVQNSHIIVSKVFFLKGKPSLIAEVSVITVSKVQLPTPLFIFLSFLFMTTVKT